MNLFYLIVIQIEEIRIIEKEKKSILLALNYLNSIFRVFHYLTLISPTPNNVLSGYNASILISFLEKCEIHLNPIDIMNNTRPIEIQHNYNPSLTDNLDTLYTMNHDMVKVYKEIIRMLFEMIIICCDKFDDDDVKKIIRRTLCCGVSIEAKKWVIECLADRKNDYREEKKVDFMDFEE